MAYLPSAAQINYLRDLCAKRVAPSLGATRDERTAALENWLRTGPTGHDVSRRIDYMKGQPVDSDAPAQAGDLTPGVYELAATGEIFVVKFNKSKTNLYAKMIIEVGSDRLNADDEHVQIDFVYAPGAIRRIKITDKMSVERAKGFMIRYGRCMACGRHLKVAQSVEQGMGPVCVKYYA